MKKFHAVYWRPSIEEIEIERETKNCVWRNGRRSAKKSEGEGYFDTWQEAHGFLSAIVGKDVDRARQRLQLAHSKLGNIKGMSPPQKDTTTTDKTEKE